MFLHSISVDESLPTGSTRGQTWCMRGHGHFQKIHFMCWTVTASSPGKGVDLQRIRPPGHVFSQLGAEQRCDLFILFTATNSVLQLLPSHS